MGPIIPSVASVRKDPLPTHHVGSRSLIWFSQKGYPTHIHHGTPQPLSGFNERGFPPHPTHRGSSRSPMRVQ